MYDCISGLEQAVLEQVCDRAARFLSVRWQLTVQPVMQSAEMAAMVRMQRQLAANQAAMAQQLREAQAAAQAAQRAVQQVQYHMQLPSKSHPTSAHVIPV